MMGWELEHDSTDTTGTKWDMTDIMILDGPKSRMVRRSDLGLT